MSPITDKRAMYQLLAAGKFGNTIPQYFSVADWRNSGDAERFPLWGVRSARISGHPACRLNCPVAEVPQYAAQHFGDGSNISMMVDAVATVTAWLEVYESASGLVVEGIEWPKTSEGWDWRNSMRSPDRRRRWERAAARAVLAKHLNANSQDDLRLLLDSYPEHVVEMSALNRCLGTAPMRNAVLWEVRLY